MSCEMNEFADKRWVPDRALNQTLISRLFVADISPILEEHRAERRVSLEQLKRYLWGLEISGLTYSTATCLPY